MSKFVIAVHGGASDASTYLKQHQLESRQGIEQALKAGHQILKRGGSALRAVEEAVMVLEDDPFFNAGRGSVLNSSGEVEMDASIMDGKTLKAGAVSMVRSVRNPVHLARIIMTKTKHVLLSGYGAIEFAKDKTIKLEPASYFVTDHQREEFLKACKPKIKHGTVGAVALDKQGNLAAATSTGGTSHSLPGRIGDSCIIGAGCYANNNTCAVSGTGEGEYLIRGVVAHTISMLVELKKMDLQKACDYVMHKRGGKPGEMGVIAVNKKGEVVMSFNTAMMRRGYMTARGELFINVYR